MEQGTSKSEGTMSLELCKIIEKNHLKKDISEKILDLISEGADINFQDYYSDTPLHLAVLKQDGKCVEFLLECYPDLNIKNKDGSTPEDIARKLSMQDNDDIEKILQTARSTLKEIGKFPAADQRFIQEFDCESLSANIIDNFNKNKNFKILKIQNCKSVLALLKKMDEENFKTSFKNRSHLFIIVIETSENLNDVDPEVLSLLGSIFDQLEHFVWK